MRFFTILLACFCILLLCSHFATAQQEYTANGDPIWRISDANDTTMTISGKHLGTLTDKVPSVQGILCAGCTLTVQDFRIRNSGSSTVYTSMFLKILFHPGSSLILRNIDAHHEVRIDPADSAAQCIFTASKPAKRVTILFDNVKIGADNALATTGGMRGILVDPTICDADGDPAPVSVEASHVWISVTCRLNCGVPGDGYANSAFIISDNQINAHNNILSLFVHDSYFSAVERDPCALAPATASSGKCVVVKDLFVVGIGVFANMDLDRIEISGNNTFHIVCSALSATCLSVRVLSLVSRRPLTLIVDDADMFINSTTPMTPLNNAAAEFEWLEWALARPTAFRLIMLPTSHVRISNIRCVAIGSQGIRGFRVDIDIDNSTLLPSVVPPSARPPVGDWIDKNGDIPTVFPGHRREMPLGDLPLATQQSLYKYVQIALVNLTMQYFTVAPLDFRKYAKGYLGDHAGAIIQVQGVQSLLVQNFTFTCDKSMDATGIEISITSDNDLYPSHTAAASSFFFFGITHTSTVDNDKTWSVSLSGSTIQIDYIHVDTVVEVRGGKFQEANGVSINALNKPTTSFFVYDVTVTRPVSQPYPTSCSSTFAVPVAFLFAARVRVRRVRMEWSKCQVAAAVGLSLAALESSPSKFHNVTVIFEEIFAVIRDSPMLGIGTGLFITASTADEKFVEGDPDAKKADSYSRVVGTRSIVIADSRIEIPSSLSAATQCGTAVMGAFTFTDRIVIRNVTERSAGNGLFCAVANPAIAAVSTIATPLLSLQRPCSRINKFSVSTRGAANRLLLAQRPNQKFAAVRVDACSNTKTFVPATRSRSVSYSDGNFTNTIEPTASHDSLSLSETRSYVARVVISSVVSSAAQSAVMSLGMAASAPGGVNVARKALGLFKMASCVESAELLVDELAKSKNGKKQQPNDDNDDDDETYSPISELGFDSNPFGVSFGSGGKELASHRGAVIGNFVVVIVWAAVMVVVAFIRWRVELYRSSKNPNNSNDSNNQRDTPPSRRSSDNAEETLVVDVGVESSNTNERNNETSNSIPPPMTFFECLFGSNFPGMLIIPVNILGPPTVAASLILVMAPSMETTTATATTSSSSTTSSSNGSDLFIMFIGLAVFLIAPLVVFAWAWRKVGATQELFDNGEISSASILQPATSTSPKTNSITTFLLTEHETEKRHKKQYAQRSAFFLARGWRWLLESVQEWAETPWLEKFGLVFDSYRLVAFAGIEYLAVTLIGVASGLAQLCEGGACCKSWVSICLVACFVYVALIAKFKPYNCRFDRFVLIPVALLLLLLSILVLCSILSVEGLLSALEGVTAAAFYCGLAASVVYMLDDVVLRVVDAVCVLATGKPLGFVDDDEKEHRKKDNKKKKNSNSNKPSASRSSNPFEYDEEEQELWEREWARRNNNSSSSHNSHRNQRTPRDQGNSSSGNGGGSRRQFQFNNSSSSNRSLDFDELLLTTRPTNRGAAVSQQQQQAAAFPASFGKLQNREHFMQRFEELQQRRGGGTQTAVAAVVVASRERDRREQRRDRETDDSNSNRKKTGSSTRAHSSSMSSPRRAGDAERERERERRHDRSGDRGGEHSPAASSRPASRPASYSRRK